MVRITAIKNPLEPTRNRQLLEMPNGYDIEYYLNGINPPIPTFYDLAILYNGQLIDLENPPPVPENCEIVFCAIPAFGGGDTAKLVTKMVAMVAIAALSAGLGAWAGATYGASLSTALGGAISATTASAIIGTGVGMVGMMAGAFLLNAILPTGAIASKTEDITESNTYSWDVGTNKINEGMTLPVLYGFMRITPAMISHAVILKEEGTKEYLQLIYALTQWTIDTPNHTSNMISYLGNLTGKMKLIQIERDQEVRNVTLNDIEIEKYDNITQNRAAGSNYQKVLSGFEGAWFNHVINHKLNDNDTEPYSEETEGSLLDIVDVVYSFPRGLYAVSGSGTVKTSVAVKLEYSLDGGSNWTNVTSKTEAGWELSGPTEFTDLAFDEGYGDAEFWVAGYWEEGKIDGRTLADEDKFVMLKHEAAGTASSSSIWLSVKMSGYINIPLSLQTSIDGITTDEVHYYMRPQGGSMTYPFNTYTDDNTYATRWTAGYFTGDTYINTETGKTEALWMELESSTAAMGHEEGESYDGQTTDDGGQHEEGDIYTPTDETPAKDANAKCYWYIVHAVGAQYARSIYYGGKFTTQYFEYEWQDSTEKEFIVFTDNSTSQCIKHHEIRFDQQTTQKVKIRTKRYNDGDKYKEFTKLTEGQNQMYLAYFSEFTNIQFIYPNVSLYALQILATDQISGSIPTLKCTISKQSVCIPNSKLICTTENLKESDYTYKSARNPAWVCYDILHGARILEVGSSTGPGKVLVSGFIKSEDIDYEMFEEWAKFCYESEGLEDLNPVRVKPQFVCDIYFDTTVNVRKALDTVGLLGRGSVTQSGTQFTCTIEKPEETPIQRFIFNMSNIEESSYNETWLPFDDRANCIEVKFWDADNNYEADVVTIINDQYETDNLVFLEEKKTSIDYIGCTDRVMASYFGKFLLNCNRYITLTSSWTSYIDAIGCYPGQIIEVQNDVPQYGYGGRIVRILSGSSIVVDRDLTFELSQMYELVIYTQNDVRIYYRLQLKSNEEILDAVIGCEINTTLFNFYDDSNQSVTFDLSTYDADLSDFHDAKYNFGKVNSSSKLMRVMSISHAGDQKRKITAVEFLNQVYDGSLTITPFDPSDLPSEFKPPALLEVTCDHEWIFNKDKKFFDPYIIIELVLDPEADYTNTFLIDSYEIQAYLEKGNTVDKKYYGKFDIKFNWPTLIFQYSAWGFNDYTIYTNGRTHNRLNYYSFLARETRAHYVDLSYNASFHANTEIYQNCPGTTYGYSYDKTTYVVAIKWNPAGCTFVQGTDFYTPILDWNGGDNYYMYSNYVIAYGFTTAANEYPNFNELTFIETATIGDIYDVTGKLIDPTDAINYERIHNILTTGAMYGLQLKYEYKFVHIAVVAKTKMGGISNVDTTLSNLGLDWVTVFVPVPYINLNIFNTQIEDATLIVKQMPKTVYLTKMQWAYPLEAPYIDGFALIYRLQTYWWCWPVIKTIPNTATFQEIITIENGYIDFSLMGGADGVASMIKQLESWIIDNDNAYAVSARQPHPYFYMSFTDNENYEIIKINLKTDLNIPRYKSYRNVEQFPNVYFEYAAQESLQGWTAVSIYKSKYFQSYQKDDVFVVMLPGEETWRTTVYTIVQVTPNSNGFIEISFSPQIVETSWPQATILIIGDFDGSSTVPTWNAGAVLSYVPNEFNDSVAYISDTALRSFVFGDTVEVKCAIHLTMVAFKVISEENVDDTPGYQRTNYIVWEVKQEATSND